MIHPYTNIHSEAKIGEGVQIEAFVTIEKDVEIGDGCWIGPNVSIMEGARIGKNVKIHIWCSYIQCTTGLKVSG